MYWFYFADNGRLLLRRTKSGLHLLMSPLPGETSVRVDEVSETDMIRFLTCDGEICHVVAAISEVSALGEGMYEWVDLRSSFDCLPLKEYRLAGKAAELHHFDVTERYCSCCGSRLIKSTEISKVCPDCQREVWPALTPAIIVAITRNEGKELLMVQSRQFKGDYYGLVAGFVEAGESLEECLRREVMEETGYSVKNIRYFASQPWPYPNGLMIGFTAECAGGTFQLQTSELRKGGWFTRQSLPDIPGKVSLARRLIDHWLSSE